VEMGGIKIHVDLAQLKSLDVVSQGFPITDEELRGLTGLTSLRVVGSLEDSFDKEVLKDLTLLRELEADEKCQEEKLQGLTNLTSLCLPLGSMRPDLPLLKDFELC